MINLPPGSRWTPIEGPLWNKHRQRYYRCRCECGTVKDVPAYNLISGVSLSCGCLRRERLLSKSRYEAEVSLDG